MNMLGTITILTDNTDHPMQDIRASLNALADGLEAIDGAPDLANKFKVPARKGFAFLRGNFIEVAAENGKIKLPATDDTIIAAINALVETALSDIQRHPHAEKVKVGREELIDLLLLAKQYINQKKAESK